MYTNRAYKEEDPLTSPDQLIYFDVLPTRPHPDDWMTGTAWEPAPRRVIEKLRLTLYRIVFAISFLIQRYLSKYLAVPVFLIGLMTLKVLKLFPGCQSDDELSERRKISIFRMIYMFYPYVYMWRSFFIGIEGFFTEFHLPSLSKTPVLLLYGASKGTLFHDKKLEDMLKKKHGSSKSDAIGIPNAGHWLYLQQPKECYDAVKHFLFD